MNDVYTGFFILAAYLVFAWLWLEPGRSGAASGSSRPSWACCSASPSRRSGWPPTRSGRSGSSCSMRSALGRLLLIAGMIVLTAVLGWMALAVPVDSGGAGNLPFILIMIGLTLATVVLSVYHPVEWSDDEMRFAVAAPAAAGILIALHEHRPWARRSVHRPRAAPVHAGRAGLRARAPGADRVRRVHRRRQARRGPDGARARPGRGRVARLPRSPAPEGWVRLGWGLRLPGGLAGDLAAGDPARRLRRSRTCRGRSSRTTSSSRAGPPATPGRRSSSSSGRCTATTTT